MDSCRKRKFNDCQDKVFASCGVSRTLQKAAADVVRHANSLPKLGHGFELYASFPEYSEFMHQQRFRIVSIMKKLAIINGCAAKFSEEALEDMSAIISSNDIIVDRITTSIDDHQSKQLESSNYIKAPNITPAVELISSSKIKITGEPIESNSKFTDYGRYSSLSKSFNANQVSINKSVVIMKPQRLFFKLIDNSDAPFVHKPKVKHNALPRKRMDNLRYVSSEYLSDPSSSFEKSDTSLIHPYQYELDAQEFLKEQFCTTLIVKDFVSLNESTLVYVDTLVDLKKTVEDLKSVSEFSFDLEHHDLRSFMGLTCLVQISTRHTDYIIDPFPIWEYMFLLNEVFSDPKILKVAHSAENDVFWLQRDFGIYVLNLFDTRCSMRLLHYSKQSLSHLLETKCGVFPDKSWQRADWRVRPLTEPMINYARSDTHYLLYCYDRLKMELLEVPASPSALHVAFKNSKQITYLLYEKQCFDPTGYMKLLHTRRRFNNRQLHALKELWKWRDGAARDQDESLQYVLPDHMMLHISEVLPKEIQGILACCSPIPPLVKNQLTTLYRIVKTARDLPLEQTRPFTTSIERAVDELFLNSTFEANRITKLRAKLEYHFDCTNHKSDDIIPDINLILERKNISTFVDFVSLNMDKGISHNPSCSKGQYDVSYEDDKLDQSDVDSKLNVISKRLENWSSPYDTYLVALLKRDETNNNDVDVNKDQQNSHESEIQIKAEIEEESAKSNSDYECHDRTSLRILQNNPQILTKKARKILLKANKRAASISLL